MYERYKKIMNLLARLARTHEKMKEKKMKEKLWNEAGKKHRKLKTSSSEANREEW